MLEPIESNQFKQYHCIFGPSEAGEISVKTLSAGYIKP